MPASILGRKIHRAGVGTRLPLVGMVLIVAFFGHNASLLAHASQARRGNHHEAAAVAASDVPRMVRALEGVHPQVDQSRSHPNLECDAGTDVVRAQANDLTGAAVPPGSPPLVQPALVPGDHAPSISHVDSSAVRRAFLQVYLI